MSFIMMNPMRFMSVRPFSTEKTFRSRIDSAMLADKWSAFPLDLERYEIYWS